jgi:hypothetical protein
MVFLLIGLSASVYSESDMTFKVGHQLVDGSYSSDSIKKSIKSSGVIFNIEYLDDVSITHTNTDTKIKFVDPDNNINQTSKFTAISYNLYSDDYGKINLRTDYHHIDNNDATGATDDVRINSYQASVFPYDDSYYAEIGFSKSKYPYIGNIDHLTPLTIKQLNISYAKSLTGADWFTLKAYRVNSSDKDRSHNKENYNALEAKYKYFLAENPIAVNNLEFSILSGRRIFAVDGAAGSAYNMGDLQIGSVGLSAEWIFSENTNLLSSVSREKYQTDADVNYTGNYKYLNFNYNF